MPGGSFLFPEESPTRVLRTIERGSVSTTMVSFCDFLISSCHGRSSVAMMGHEDTREAREEVGVTTTICWRAGGFDLLKLLYMIESETCVWIFVTVIVCAQ